LIDRRIAENKEITQAQGCISAIEKQGISWYHKIVKEDQKGGERSG